MSEQPRDAATPGGPHADVTDLDQVMAKEPIHERDRIPAFLLDAQSRLFGLVSRHGRYRIAVAIVAIAVAVALVLTSTRLLRNIFEALDIFSFVGLFLVNWVGNGGALVPIPGARMLGLLMVFQHAVLFPSWEVLAVSGSAMALGLLSYYIAGARSARAYRRGDEAHAAELAADSGVVGEDDAGSMPGAAIVGGSDETSRRHRLIRRFADSWEKSLQRARPTVDRHGTWGMFWLCFTPTALGTGAAFLGGAMGFGFVRYLLASFGSKYLLAAIIVIVALLFAS